MGDGFGGFSVSANRVHKKPCADVSHTNDEGFLSTVVDRDECTYEDGTFKSRETRTSFEIVEAQREKAILREKRTECLNRANKDSREIADNFFEHVKHAEKTFETPDYRERYVQLAFRDARSALIQLRSELVADPDCLEAAYQPIEWMDGLQKYFQYYLQSKRIPSEKYVDSIVNVARWEASATDVYNTIQITLAGVMPPIAFYGGVGAISGLIGMGLGVTALSTASMYIQPPDNPFETSQGCR